MSSIFDEEATSVPQADGQSVRIDPGQPWPSAYRGSKYSLVSHDDFAHPMVKWGAPGSQDFHAASRRIAQSLGIAG